VSSDVPRQRILLVEDDSAVAGLLTKYLTQRGYEVTQAADAEVALEKYREEGYDIVVTDVHLPGASGIKLAEHLREISPFQPVVLVTGDRDEIIAKAAMDVGATAYLLKPFETSEFEAAVRQALKDRELSDSAIDLVRADFARSASVQGLGAVSSQLLYLAEQRAGSAEGHGLRVARLAAALLMAADLPSSDEVEMAARVHEIGALIPQTDSHADVRFRSLFLLREILAEPLVIDLVDGLFRPAQYANAQDRSRRNGTAALYLADQLDHAFTTKLSSGGGADEASRYAFGIVLVKAEPSLPGALLDALLLVTDVARELWRQHPGTARG
jgi:DNA-binding response OmpR family regulator